MLVVGLGNPGDAYRGTRHNVGADAVEMVAERHGERLRSGREHARVAEVRLEERRVMLAVPTTFMNDSGRAVQALWRRSGVTEPEQILIVHDELDLPPGEVRVKRGGGLAGHNGLRSITAHLKTTDYLRVRIGIGKPPGGKERGADHVLSKVRGSDREVLAVGVQVAADAVIAIATEGVEPAMARFNTRNR